MATLLRILSCACLLAAVSAWPAAAEAPRGPAAVEAAAAQFRPSPLPPAGSPELLRTVELAFPTQGNVSSVDAQTYLYYMEIPNHRSLPSQNRWVPYTQDTERIIREDFRRLWDTGFLDDLWIEVVDEPWENGVVGKRVIFNFEERQRVKVVTFEGSEEVDRSDIDTAMQENGLAIRVDSFQIGRASCRERV